MRVLPNNAAPCNAVIIPSPAFTSAPAVSNNLPMLRRRFDGRLVPTRACVEQRRMLREQFLHARRIAVRGADKFIYQGLRQVIGHKIFPQFSLGISPRRREDREEFFLFSSRSSHLRGLTT
jgi:hypothetical protein